jgi:cation diffusion facilitator family transporter
MATHENTSDEERRTRRSIYAALTANLLIAISKFVAGFISGSAALLAEGAHSVADTINQVFLLISLPLSKSGPDSEHPYGHGQDRFFWTLLVAVGLFVAGAVFSVYEGVTKITGSESGEHGSYLIGYIVLGVAFVFEAIALVITVREFRRAARTQDRSFWNHFKVTRNTTMKVPLYEDAAALTGLIIAALGLFLAQVTGNMIFDGIASIVVGVVLIAVAWELGTDSRGLLLGEALLPEDRQRIRQVITSFLEVTDILRLLTMHLGPDAVLVNAEIHVVDGLETDQIEELLERITRAMRDEMPEIAYTFIELHPPGRTGQSPPKNGAAR